MRTESSSSRPGAPLAAATTAVVIWGFAPVFVETIGATGLVTATYRMVLGAPVMWAINRLMGGRVTRDILKVAAPAGVLFVADIILGFSAFEHTSLAIASIIGSLFPAVVLLVSGPLFGESVRPVDVAWFVVALAGTAIVVGFGESGGDTSLLGVVYSVGSLGTWTTYFLYVKRRRLDGVPAFAFMTGVIGTGAVAIVPYALLFADDLGQVRGTDFVWLLALILLPGAAGHGLMTWAHAHLSANVASILTLGGPLVTIAAAWVCFGETITATQALGVAAVFVAMGGVLLGHRAVAAAALEDEPVAGIVP